MTTITAKMFDDGITIKEQKEYFNGKLIITKRHNRNGLITYKKNPYGKELRIKYLKASVKMLFAGDILYTLHYDKEGLLVETKLVRGSQVHQLTYYNSTIETQITEIQKDHA